MDKMKIVKISGYKYKLENQRGRRYDFDIEFIDVQTKPKVGDFIFWSSKNTEDPEERYAPRTYGPPPSIYGRRGENVQDIDFIVVVTEETMTLLQRWYG
jgi:hypothetical protein